MYRSCVVLREQAGTGLNLFGGTGCAARRSTLAHTRPMQWPAASLSGQGTAYILHEHHAQHTYVHTCTRGGRVSQRLVVMVRFFDAGTGGTYHIHNKLMENLMLAKHHFNSSEDVVRRRHYEILTYRKLQTF